MTAEHQRSGGPPWGFSGTQPKPIIQRRQVSAQHGRPVGAPAHTTPTPLDEFLRRYPVRLPDGRDGCWIWAGGTAGSYKGRNRYGRMRLADKSSCYVHRYTFGLAYGALDPDAVLVRLVDRCESSRCCNPAHWRPTTRALVTPAMSALGTISRGLRHAIAVTTAVRRRAQKLDAEKAAAIRASVEPTRVLAERYGVDPSLIQGIRRGRYWRQATPFAGLEERAK